MVDAAQLSRGNQHDRQVLPGEPIDQVFLPGERYAKSPYPFAQNVFIAFFQFLAGSGDLSRVDPPSVDLGRQVRRTGYSKDKRTGKPLRILRQCPHAHHQAVAFDVLRSVHTTRLSDLLRHHALSPIDQVTGKGPRYPGFSGIGVDPGNEVCFLVFHHDLRIYCLDVFPLRKKNSPSGRW